ncbi:hypothetical protein JCM30471_16830 [Desulfuromonas carbonis]
MPQAFPFPRCCRRLSQLALLCALLLPAGCQTPVAPIPTRVYFNPAPQGAEKLMIMLRGIGGDEEIFDREGLIRELFVRGYPFDVVAPAAHFGYYREESLGQRLEADIIAPARARGYREIWLVGTSMGGLGALMYLTAHPGEIAGVILLGPFLGWGAVPEEIAAAGGIANWQPGAVDVKEDWERFLWAWLKEYAARPDPVPPIYLGYGSSDFFFSQQEVLARLLPAERVLVVPGGHTYLTLRLLWTAELDRLDATLRR